LKKCGSSAYLSFLGSEQPILSVPACQQFFFRPDGNQLGIYSGGLDKETIPLPGGETQVVLYATCLVKRREFFLPRKPMFHK
jgi:hypothetical protein